jgi:hypothetical protein
VPAKRAGFSSIEAVAASRLKVPQHAITRRDLVDREIAFEHAELSVDQFYAGLDLGVKRAGEYLRRTVRQRGHRLARLAGHQLLWSVCMSASRSWKR